MKIVKANGCYRIYGDSLKVYDKLPAGIYIVRFSPLQGFYLEDYSGLEVNEEKIYGVHLAKINKVMKSLKQFKRNLGVILSGDKGIGKSLFAKLLCQAAVEKGYPVVVVDSFESGIHSFIEDIQQEAVVLFDEFDKTFPANNNSEDSNQSPQVSLLSLLDGTSSGKKMFVVTCNDLYSLNEFLVNRPGRFHYHFRFGYPSAEEIRIYLQDKIDQQYWPEISKVIMFSSKVKLNYDCLRAIAFELQNGERFEDAIDDLNILNVSNQSYDIAVHFTNGQTAYRNDYSLDMFSNSIESLWLCNDDSDMGEIEAEEPDATIIINFVPNKAKYDSLRKCSVVDKASIKVDFNANTETKKRMAKKFIPDYMTIVKAEQDNFRYAV